MELFACTKYFNKSKASFTTFAYFRMRKAISNYLYRSQYPYGHSPSFYYKRIKNGENITSVSINKYDIEDIEYIEDIEVDGNYSLSQDCIVKFISKVNHKYDSSTCDIIVDYYIDGMSYHDLRKKYGNIARCVKKLNLDHIFEEIKQEIKEDSHDN